MGRMDENDLATVGKDKGRQIPVRSGAIRKLVGLIPSAYARTARPRRQMPAGGS